MRSVSPEAIAGLRCSIPLVAFIFKLPWARQKLYCTTDTQLIHLWYKLDVEKASVFLTLR
jgi:hypothetical protein